MRTHRAGRRVGRLARRRTAAALAAVLAAGLLVSCSSDAPAEGPPDPAGSAQPEGEGEAQEAEFFEEDEYQRQLALSEETPEGPEGRPWEQMLRPEMVSTEEYALPEGEGIHLCFSNAGVFNPWRQVGLTTMEAEVAQHEEIAEFTVLDAEGKDDKQISDIQNLSEQDCDLLIVSPNTTATLTPAVEEACTRLPVIVFDRGVNTDCPVTFVHPVGGYAYGAAAADFLVENVEPGGKILALRISPGVDVLENRWSAAELAFEDSELEVADVEFTEGDPAVTKSVVSDAIARHGSIDGVWMDSGATAVAAIEAFEDAGLDVPPISGEDQQDFLQAWAERDLTAIAPGYPTFQWRTPVIAALKVLRGEEVPGEWVLPQPVITEENRDDYVNEDLPPLHYGLCGCEDLPGYPQDWGGR
ncbi:substrate-binding domain-containing protein [Streptomyces triticirhizae]|uniref:ABC transporter substrate-binding protein n=1 Tax=Streptomyces triticirhizae TaxID=2483353 RepID=A0A3M2LR24_9ACTN|nr:substrate-binding domain-containing protein [Streptomyces triticirhizae]RMI39837.1 ABC transporter substrate-binding protein [Streptomyces triticirhizae]